jgi:hypothetical protein
MNTHIRIVPILPALQPEAFSIATAQAADGGFWAPAQGETISYHAPSGFVVVNHEGRQLVGKLSGLAQGEITALVPLELAKARIVRSLVSHEFYLAENSMDETLWMGSFVPIDAEAAFQAGIFGASIMSAPAPILSTTDLDKCVEQMPQANFQGVAIYSGDIEAVVDGFVSKDLLQQLQTMGLETDSAGKMVIGNKKKFFDLLMTRLKEPAEMLRQIASQIEYPFHNDLPGATATDAEVVDSFISIVERQGTLLDVLQGLVKNCL